MNTSGFYKLDGELLYGPNFVLNANYELRKESHNEYNYPVDGWYWFDSENDARIFFKFDHYPTQEEVNGVVEAFLYNNQNMVL
jgi:hypothetical protein